DRTMPEEINRLVTDRLSSLLFTPSRDGDAHLIAEGVERERIRFVGNVMIDTLVRLLPAATGEHELRRVWLVNGSGAVPFALVTLHRPSNVDEPSMLARLIASLERVAEDVPVVCPAHPRTRARMASFGIAAGRIAFVEPLTYLEFLGLQRHAA